ncbi:hypothetical protein ASZ90_011299 [hydrocarbon metagenome]|uniref:Uncharacterized protein n=1 Tax=hydrocarbon metagenome TaxID=938273 RepID=A0A0W8FDM9_9ZZZZ
MQVMTSSTVSKRSPFNFFLLVYALSVPFWVLNTLVQMNLPVDNLPVTDIGGTFAPMIAASILVYREEGSRGVTRLLARAFDYNRIRQNIWYVPIIFLMPLLLVLTYGILLRVRLPVPTE